MAENEFRGVLPLYEPEGYQLHVDDTGRGSYQTVGAAQESRGSIPSASLSGRSNVSPASQRAFSGMGGTMANGPAAQRSLSPKELMALADQMQSQLQFEPGPTAVEPTMERDTNVPYWLRTYAEKEGL